MPPHSLTDSKYENIIKMNLNLVVLIQGTISLKQKMGTFMINLDDYESFGAHWTALYVNDNNVTYLIVLRLNIFQKKLKNS